MTLRISPALLKGSITPPPSKSQAHRMLIAAALAEGESAVRNLDPSEDILATVGALEALGARCVLSEQGAAVTRRGGLETEAELPELNCGESGSTLRFLIPVALALRGGGVFTGRGRLMERPLEPYFELFRQKGVQWKREEDRLLVRGALTPGIYRLPGDVSSQFVTGLLFALPLLPGDSRIELTTPLESRGYVDMTLEALERFGVSAEPKGESAFGVPGNQRYAPGEVTVESDYSQAAFYAAANFLGGSVDIMGLNPCSVQGDRAILPLAEELKTGGEKDIDVSQCPDLVPALAVMAALRAGEVTRLSNAARLRMKESDRLDAMCTQLSGLGADVKQEADSLLFRGVARLRGGPADSRNDHRIAMALGVAAARCDGEIELSGAEAVGKSYPRFWEDYRRLGGKVQ